MRPRAPAPGVLRPRSVLAAPGVPGEQASELLQTRRHRPCRKAHPARAWPRTTGRLRQLQAAFQVLGLARRRCCTRDLPAGRKHHISHRTCLSTSHCRQRESRDSRKIAHRIDLDARVISSAREPGKQVNSRILAVLSQGFQDHRMFPDTDSATEGTRAHAAGPLSRQPEDFLERQELTYVILGLAVRNDSLSLTIRFQPFSHPAES